MAAYVVAFLIPPPIREPPPIALAPDMLFEPPPILVGATYCTGTGSTTGIAVVAPLASLLAAKAAAGSIGFLSVGLKSAARS
jgi:hypothetical protein